MVDRYFFDLSESILASWSSWCILMAVFKKSVLLLKIYNNR